MSSDPVHLQYEDYPYPPRDPADEAKRLITGSPSHLDELNHYVFAGRRDFRRAFRALIAGGGTGDAAIMLAQQLADVGGPGEVVYIDLSGAARHIAEARARARRLTNIRFLRLSLLALPDSGLGRFDYIDCCGVLHHLEQPVMGLKALVEMLAPAGGIGLMLYGELGRTGVYPMQEMLRLLAGDDPPPARLDLARRLIGQLPDTNWLRRNPFVRDHLQQGDAGLYDLLLHARDRAFRVPEIADLAAAAGLRITAFIPPALYDPASYLRDAKLIARLAGRSWLERAAFAELLAGNMRKHVLYAVSGDNAIALPDPKDRRAVPVLRDIEGAEMAQQIAPGAAMTATVDGITFRRPLPPLAAAILRRIDGRRSLADIHADLSRIDPRLDWSAFAAQFRVLYESLSGLGKLYLAFPGGGPASRRK